MIEMIQEFCDERFWTNTVGVNEINQKNVRPFTLISDQILNIYCILGKTIFRGTLKMVCL